MGQPIIVPVALAAAAATGISTLQTVPSAGALAINGSLSSGASANSICTTQSSAGAGALTLNGSAVSGGVAYIFGKAVTITSTGDDHTITATVLGLGADGYSAASETVHLSNTSVVATQTVFHSVSSVTVSGATGGNVTVGTNGVATLSSLGMARQVLLTFGTDDTGNVYTVTGTNAGGFPITDTVAGGVTTGVSTKHFQTVSKITAKQASAGTVTAGTNGVGSSEFVSLNYHAQPVNISVAAVVSGTINYTVQWTYDDPNKVTPTWWDDATAASKTANQVTTMNDPVFGSRVLINSFTAPGNVTTTYIQAGLVGF